MDIINELKLIEISLKYPDCKDVHKLAAAVLFDIPPDEVNEDQRKAGKNLNYMKLYSNVL